MKSFRRIVLGLLALACLAGRAEPALPPAPKRWATDRAHYLREETRARLDMELEAYERSSHHQVILWIGDSLHGVPIEDFAARAMRAWGIGRKEEKDGVVFFVFAKDRKVRIEVGYGLEERIPDAVAHRIISERVAPKLKAGDPDGALEDGVHLLLATLAEGQAEAAAGSAEPPAALQGPPPSSADPAGCILTCVVFIFFIAIVGFIANLMYRKGLGGTHWGSGSGSSWSSSSDSDWGSSSSDSSSSSDFSGGGGDSGGGGASGDW